MRVAEFPRSDALLQRPVAVFGGHVPEFAEPRIDVRWVRVLVQCMKVFLEFQPRIMLVADQQ